MLENTRIHRKAKPGQIILQRKDIRRFLAIDNDDEALTWTSYLGESFMEVSRHSVALKGHSPFRFLTQR